MEEFNLKNNGNYLLKRNDNFDIYEVYINYISEKSNKLHS